MNLWALELYRGAKKQAARRNIPFTLTPEEFAGILSDRCALTGIRFEIASAGRGVRRPFAPSLDRIDSAGPYSAANVRLVCVAVNVALNVWGEAVLRRIALGLLGAEDGRLPRGVKLRGKRYIARIRFDGAEKHLGSFATPEAAGEAYKAAKCPGFAPSLTEH